MFHNGTRRLIEYWCGLAEGDQAPARAAVDPARLADLLPRVFLLDRTAEGLCVRLAGELLRDLWGRPVKGTAFDGLWRPEGRDLAGRAARQAVRERAAVVIVAEGLTAEGDAVGLEVALAPLRGDGRSPDGLLGLLQPTTPLARLYGRPLEGLSPRLAVTASGSAAGAEAGRPALALAAVDGRRIA